MELEIGKGKYRMIYVVLVNYNGTKDTIECIESLKESNYREFQIIVVDNCSSDNSVDVLKQYQKKEDFILVPLHSNNGFSAGNNIGIRYAISQDADFIWLLNNDTLVEPDTMDNLLNPFINHSLCGATTAKIFYENDRKRIWYAGGSINDKTSRTEHWRIDEIDNDKNEPLTSVTFSSGCCIFLSREAVERAGLMDESYFLYEEDAEYCIRIRKAGFEIIYNPEAVVYHKVSSSTGESSPLKQYYSVRNRYSLIRNMFHKKNKKTAYLYATAQMVYRCIKRELKFKFFFSGVIGFLKHETGKTDRI